MNLSSMNTIVHLAMPVLYFITNIYYISCEWMHDLYGLTSCEMNSFKLTSVWSNRYVESNQVWIPVEYSNFIRNRQSFSKILFTFCKILFF